MTIKSVERLNFEKWVLDNFGLVENGVDLEKPSVKIMWLAYQQGLKVNNDLLEDANKWASDYLIQLEAAKDEIERRKDAGNMVLDGIAKLLEAAKNNDGKINEMMLIDITNKMQSAVYILYESDK